MKKKVLVVMSAALMLISVPLTAQAETYTGKSGWKVDFDGKSMNTNFKNNEINDALYKLQPGDTVNITVNLVNSHDTETDWYMTNEVLQSLEDSQSVANGGAYTYKLTYVNPEGIEQLIYNSDSIGGEGSTAGGEGLHQATNTLEDFFYLDYLEPGESGQVKLSVSLDGETQGNSYQDTLAKLQMNFAVEPLVVPEGSTVAERPVLPIIVQTGDQIGNLIFSIATLAGGLIFVILALVKRKRESETEYAVKGADIE